MTFRERNAIINMGEMVRFNKELIAKAKVENDAWDKKHKDSPIRYDMVLGFATLYM